MNWVKLDKTRKKTLISDFDICNFWVLPPKVITERETRH